MAWLQRKEGKKNIEKKWKYFLSMAWLQRKQNKTKVEINNVQGIQMPKFWAQPPAADR